MKEPTQRQERRSSFPVPYPTENWTRWVTALGEVTSQISNLHTKRLIWRRYQTWGRDRYPKDDTSIFHDWLVANYGDSMAVGIRRVLDTDTRTASLYRLLMDIAAHPDDLNLDNYLRLWDVSDGWWVEPARRAFASVAGNDSQVDGPAVAEEARGLRDRVDRILTHVDKRIAHSDRDKANHPLPTWAELDEALEPIVETHAKYVLLLTAAAYRLDWTGMPAGWERVFERMDVGHAGGS